MQFHSRELSLVLEDPALGESNRLSVIFVYTSVVNKICKQESRGCMLGAT
jgi:hypothetical protein